MERMDYPEFIASNQKEESISIQRVKAQSLSIKVSLFSYLSTETYRPAHDKNGLNTRKPDYACSIKIVCAPKVAFISLPINLNMCFCAQKNRLIETVLLSTNNICFGLEIRKTVFQYTLLSEGLFCKGCENLVKIFFLAKSSV